MPTRILREGILTSERVNRLSERAENFYRRLMSVADDYGRYYASPTLLRCACYPLRVDSITDEAVKQLLSECIANDLLMLYNAGKHLFIRNFGQQTRSKSKFPEPSKNELLSNCTADVNQMRSESESKTDAKSESEPVESADHPVELPPRFPKTEKEAAVHAGFVGCTEEFAIKVWHAAVARGGRDAKDVPIRAWPNHLKAQHTYEQENARRAKIGGRGGATSPDRNAGTLNAGNSSQYRGVGRVS